MSTKKQIAIIHTLTKQLGICDDHYRDMLSAFKVSTSKALSDADAETFISNLRRLVPNAGGYAHKKYDNLPVRPGRASPAQLRKIEAIWKTVSRQPNAASRKTALDKFCKRILGIESILWIEHDQVNKIIKAMMAMKLGNSKTRLETVPATTATVNP